MNGDAYTDEFYKSLKCTSSKSAQVIVPMVMELVQPKSVVDVGCGVGAWLSVFKDLGVCEVLGIDGYWIKEDSLLIDRDSFIKYDLTKSLNIDAKFDLVVSLEVAEHLPQEYAETFVETLTSLGPVVLFSAAIPFQGGTQHLNEQWPDYWANYFSQQGYEVIDCFRSRIWKNECVDLCYAQNILLFVKRDFLKTHSRLHAEYELTDHNRLTVAHPRQYMISSTSPTVATIENMSLKVVLSAMPGLIGNAMRRYFNKLLSNKNKKYS